MILNPGEWFRVWTGNDGQFNNLTKWHATGTYYPLLEANPARENFDYADVAGAKKGTKWVLRRDRVFPHYSTGVLSFDGRPMRGNPAFEAVGADSFCYRVRSCYPITLGDYEARLADGRAADLELSTDGGKTFSSVPMRNGRATLQYRVKARHDYLVRVKASIGSVARFTARTECEVNPRTYPGWLKGGGDGVVFKAENDAPARVTFAWRRAAQPIEVKGGAYSGTLPGFERQLVLVKPGETARFAVTGTSSGATVRAFGPVRADLKGGCLEIVSDPRGGDLIARGDDLPDHGATDTAFGAVEIDDGGARKALTVLVSPDARLATADSAEVSGAAAKVAADASSVQGRVVFKKSGDKATFRFAAGRPLRGAAVGPLWRTREECGVRHDARSRQGQEEMERCQVHQREPRLSQGELRASGRARPLEMGFGHARRSPGELQRVDVPRVRPSADGHAGVLRGRRPGQRGGDGRRAGGAGSGPGAPPRHAQAALGPQLRPCSHQAVTSAKSEIWYTMRRGKEGR